jgi:hypothetical protein
VRCYSKQGEVPSAPAYLLGHIGESGAKRRKQHRHPEEAAALLRLKEGRVAMPFDVLTNVISPARLSDVLTDAGLRPVSRETLEAHKRAQLERFGPSFWYRHHHWLGIGLLASIAGMVLTSSLATRVAASGSMLPFYLMMVWLLVVVMLISSGMIPLRSGSHWEERWIPVGLLETYGVPRSIAAEARLLLRELPGATLILGELVQDVAVLDPYLLLTYRGERICLGIWDGDELIASMREDQPSGS